MATLPSSRRRGQGMTEYVIIVALIGIGTIGVVGLFGDNLRHLFGASAESLAGNTKVASNAANRATGLETKSLATFGQNGGGSTPPMLPAP